MKKFYLVKNHQIIFAILLFCFALSSYSQEKFFSEEVTVNRSSLTTIQQTKFDKIKDNPINKSVQLVSILDKQTLQRSSSLNFNLPGAERLLVMNSKSIKTDPDTGTVWSGELEGNIHGTALIIAKGNAIYGQVNIDHEIYMIEDLGNGKNLVIQLDERRFGPNECATPDVVDKNDQTPTNNDKNKEQINVPQRNGGNPIVRVLVLFTNAANNVGNPQNSANLFINQSNQALQNSGVTAAQLRFQLAGVQLLPGFVENTANPGGDLNNLRNAPSAARAMRDAAEADLVMLLTDGNYNNNNTFGIAFLLTQAAGNAEVAYGISEIDAAGGRFTFAHELAHLFGAHHNDAINPTFPFARGHNFRTGWWIFSRERRTILNRAAGNEARIQHYSNPNVNFKNVATGVVNQRDNARQLRALAPTVCDYRAFTAPPTVSISGDFNITSGEYGGQTYTANANGGTPPYTYEWCLNGSCYNSGTNNTTGHTIYPNGNPFWTLQVTVTDANGATGSSTRTIQIQQSFGALDSGVSLLDVNNIKLFPNPASQYFSLTDDGFDYKNIQLLDFKGDIIKQFNRSDRYAIDYLPKGIYFVKITHEKTSKVLKLLKH